MTIIQLKLEIPSHHPIVMIHRRISLLSNKDLTLNIKESFVYPELNFYKVQGLTF